MYKILILLMSANQGIKAWYQCYHSTKYPMTTFVHLDDVSVSERLTTFQEEPNANSTLINHNDDSHLNSSSHQTFLISQNPLSGNTTSSLLKSPGAECSHSVGHISHLPRVPPIQTNYVTPSIINKCIGTEQEDLFGMIKLKENDVCYTSGTIEWVGKKRSFPINSGFKILSENCNIEQEPHLKKVRRYSNSSSDKVKDCDCADVLPTVNAIVDHLNALHEAVDLVDLRLNTLEDTLS